MTLQIQKIEEPLQMWSCFIAVYYLRLLTASLSNQFTVLNETTKVWSRIISERLPWLLKTEKALRGFKQKIDRIEEIDGVFLKLREAFGRTPAGFITEIRIVIPESNRQTEYQIYDTFRELLEITGSLLFDLHIIKRRGRILEEAVPEGFWRYE